MQEDKSLKCVSMYVVKLCHVILLHDIIILGTYYIKGDIFFTLHILTLIEKCNYYTYRYTRLKKNSQPKIK